MASERIIREWPFQWPWGQYQKPTPGPKKAEHDPRWAKLVALYGPTYARYIIQNNVQLPMYGQGETPQYPHYGGHGETEPPADPFDRGHHTGNLQQAETDPLSKRHWSQEEQNP